MQVKHYTSSSLLLDPTSSSGTVTHVTPGLQALTDYSPHDLLGCSYLTLAGPETAHGSMRKAMSAVLGCRQAAVKMLLYKLNGSPFWAQVLICPLCGGPQQQGQSQQGQQQQKQLAGRGQGGFVKWHHFFPGMGRL